MRAAIYARMSTDKQSDTSPDDQIARCREYAEGQGWTVVESLVVAEAGISAASRHNRPRLLDLIDRVAEWDTLLCFDFSRLARDSEDMGWVRNRLRIAQRTAVESSTGLDVFNVGSKVMGVFHEEYLVKVRQDTHRGLRGRFDRKLATGGCPFGYRTVPIVVGEDAHGHPLTEGYRLEVDPERAPIVVRIFEGYAHQGLGLRALAHQLNAEGLPSARGNGWAPTAIREMLWNPIYRGERIWNRSSWIKDHETGRRRRFARPESEWLHQQDEAWRIVSDELWRAAQTARGRRNERHLRDGRGRIQRTAMGAGARRKRLLAGFLECGECGGSFHAVKPRTWGCSWHRNRGTCANGALIPEARLERAVLQAVKGALDEQVAAHALEVALDDLRKRIQAAEPRRFEAELEAVDAKIERALDLAIELGDLAAAKERLRGLRDERERLVGQLEQMRFEVPTVEELMPRLREKLRDLEATLKADVALGRLALGGLLGDRRLRIYKDGRIEGSAILAPEMLRAPRRTSEPADCDVAGGRYAPVCAPVRLVLPVVGSAAPRAA